MYVRQEAYYNSVPDGAKITRSEQIERGNEIIEENSDDDSEEEDAEDEAEQRTILERQEIPMPDITTGSEYLVAFLHSAGTASSNGMGLTGLSWQEIAAWVQCADMSGITTTRDLKTVHMLSRVYAGECSKASQKGAKAPYSPVVVLEAETRAIISAAVDDVFMNLIASQNSRGNV